jgi:hypothetical protein
MIARDLDRAIALARLHGLQTYLVQTAREMSWTAATLTHARGLPLPERNAFRLKLSSLARVVECDRATLNTAFRSLVTARIFIPADGHEGFFVINKDYADWRQPNGQDRLLTDAKIDEAKRAIQINKADLIDLKGDLKDDKIDSKTVGSTPHPCRVHPTPPVGSTPHPCRVYPTPPVGSTPHPPYRNAPVRETKRELREIDRLTDLCVREQIEPGPKSGPFATPASVATYIALKFGEGSDSRNREHYEAQARGWFNANHTSDEIERALVEAITVRQCVTTIAAIRYTTKILEGFARSAKEAADQPARPAAPPAPPRRSGIAAELDAKAKAVREYYARQKPEAAK